MTKIFVFNVNSQEVKIAESSIENARLTLEEEYDNKNYLLVRVENWEC